MFKNKNAYPPYLKKYARFLRKNMTYSEVKFWKKVRDYSMMGYDFHRQKPLLDYIADFYCAELNLVIEIDGITHETDAAMLNDHLKDQALKKLGLQVIRFSALQVVHDMRNVMRGLETYIVAFEETNGIPEKVLKRRGLY